MEIKDIKNDVKRHIWLCVTVLLSLYGVTTKAVQLFLPEYHSLMRMPMIIAAVFFLVESVVVGLIWRWVATKHISYLATFHTACSGFRILAVLAVLTVTYIFVGRDAMAPYFIAMFLFYIIAESMHTIFFVREAKRLFEEK